MRVCMHASKAGTRPGHNSPPAQAQHALVAHAPCLDSSPTTYTLPRVGCALAPILCAPRPDCNHHHTAPVAAVLKYDCGGSSMCPCSRDGGSSTCPCSREAVDVPMQQGLGQLHAPVQRGGVACAHVRMCACSRQGGSRMSPCSRAGPPPPIRSAGQRRRARPPAACMPWEVRDWAWAWYNGAVAASRAVTRLAPNSPLAQEQDPGGKRPSYL
eukprot:364980-Chlamydomonas_euryale.AAC.15